MSFLHLELPVLSLPIAARRGLREAGRRGLLATWRKPTIIAVSLVVVACLNAVVPSRAQIATQCLADQYFDRGSGADPIITEFALATREDECPLGKISIANGFDLAVGRPLYFWMRLQGSYDYARSARSSQRIDLRLFRIVDDQRLFHDAIGMGYLNRADVIREAEQAGGRFDWRLGAEKVVFIKPGVYEAAIVQGNRTVCILEPAANNCVVRFAVR